MKQCGTRRPAMPKTGGSSAYPVHTPVDLCTPPGTQTAPARKFSRREDWESPAANSTVLCSAKLGPRKDGERPSGLGRFPEDP